MIRLFSVIVLGGLFLFAKEASAESLQLRPSSGPTAPTLGTPPPAPTLRPSPPSVGNKPTVNPELDACYAEANRHLEDNCIIHPPFVDPTPADLELWGDCLEAYQKELLACRCRHGRPEERMGCTGNICETEHFKCLLDVEAEYRACQEFRGQEVVDPQTGEVTGITEAYCRGMRTTGKAQCLNRYNWCLGQLRRGPPLEL